MRFLLTLSAAISLVCMPPVTLPRIGERFEIAIRDGYITVQGKRPPCPYINKIYSGVQFKFAVNPNEDLVYIATNDPNFRTPEGIGVNATLIEVVAAGGQPVINEDGFHPYSQLPSGWCAAFQNRPMNCFGFPAFESPAELVVTEYFRR